MPDLNYSTEDIAPAVEQLRRASLVFPQICCGYFVVQLAFLGFFFGGPGALIGGFVGLMLGYVVSTVVVPVFTWMIHSLFLLHSIRNQDKQVEQE